MTWLYLSLGSALCFACLNLLSRVVSVDSKNPRALSLAFNLVSIAMATALFLLTGSYNKLSWPTQTQAWIYFLIAAFVYGMFERLRFYAAKLLDASIYSVIGNLSVVMAFFLSLFLYQEIFTVSKFIGFVLILIALLLVVGNKPGDRQGKKLKISFKGIWLGILTSALIGIGWSLDKKGAIFFNPETYNIMTWTVPFIILYFPSIKIKDVKDEFKIFSWKIVLLSFFNVAGYYLSLKALLLTEATKVIPVIQLSTLMTVIAGIFFLNEKTNLNKKILAGIIAVVGVFLLR
jgi:drug/metabolite transporter (DMT)-like permease